MGATAADRGSKVLSTVSDDGHFQILTKAETKSFGTVHLHISLTTIDKALGYEKDESKPRIGKRVGPTFEEALVLSSSLVISSSIQ